MFRSAKEVEAVTSKESAAYTSFSMELSMKLRCDRTVREAFNGDRYIFMMAGQAPERADERRKLSAELEKAGWDMVELSNQQIGHNEYQWRIILKVKS